MLLFRVTQPLTRMGNLESSINLTPLTACLRTMGGSRSTWSEPTQTWGEHANSTQKDTHRKYISNSVCLIIIIKKIVIRVNKT